MFPLQKYRKKKHSLDFKGITLHNKIGFGQAIE